MSFSGPRRMPASVHGLCLTLGALAAGCIDAGDIDHDEAATSSAIVLDLTANYTIVGVQSDKCVGVIGGSTTPVGLEIRACAGAASQRFHPEAMGGGFFRLRNELSGLCIDVSEISQADGAAIIQFACGTGQNQQWSFTDVASGAERMTARHSGKVLDVVGQAVADGTLVEQWSSNNGANQQFRLVKALSAFAP